LICFDIKEAFVDWVRKEKYRWRDRVYYNREYRVFIMFFMVGFKHLFNLYKKVRYFRIWRFEFLQFWDAKYSKWFFFRLIKWGEYLVGLGWGGILERVRETDILRDGIKNKM
jgi:hypothetical protein